MRWYEKIGNELFDPKRPQSPGEVIFFKLFELFIVFYTIKYAWEWGIYTAFRNSEVVLPLGLANYIDISLFFDYNIALINAGLITAISIFSFFRIGARWQYMVVMVLLHLQYVARFSQGEIPHSSNLIGMGLFCFAVGIWFFKDKNQMPRFIMGTIIFFIGFGYTSAFFAKLIGTGFNWYDGRHLWLWIGEKSVDILSREGVYEPNILQSLALQDISIASIILLIGWITEMIGVTMWWRKLRPYTTTLIIFMHLGITMTMNIRFDAFVIQLILIGYPWYKIFDRLAIGTPHLLKRWV